MGQLCIYLPPFASDYTGVCSALFDLHCLTAINDASCCTAHYVHYDEPRWSHEIRPVLCTTLRNADAIFGNDDKVVKRVCEAAERLDASLIALVGTPVPAIIGMDTVGIAHEVEALSGRTAFGFDTTGFNWYDKGIIMAGRALIDRFAAMPPSPRECTTSGSAKPVVNIVGMTPLDFGDVGNDKALASLLEQEGIEVGARFFMGLSIEQIEHCGEADLNLAVSASGVELAKYLERKFGTPYMAGVPVGGAQTSAWLAAVRDALSAVREGGVRGDQGATASQVQPPEQCADDRAGRILIVADQIIGNAIRQSLEWEGETRPVDVASFFTWHAALAQPGDTHLDDEASYLRLLKAGTYTTVIADPLLLELPPEAELEKTPFVHPAVSGKLHWEEVYRLP